MAERRTTRRYSVGVNTPGDRRPPIAPVAAASARPRPAPRSSITSLALAIAVGVLAAIVWAGLKGILEFPGVLAVSVVAGWAIGNLLRDVRAAPVVATVVALVTWLLGLVLTWLVAMAILPGSSRPLPERISATPFLDWQAPQFGIIEVSGLALYLLAALYGARGRGSTGA
jgi:hypothetical protein